MFDMIWQSINPLYILNESVPYEKKKERKKERSYHNHVQLRVKITYFMENLRIRTLANITHTPRHMMPLKL